MQHADHVALIRDGVASVGGRDGHPGEGGRVGVPGESARWLELGAGDGAFTLALADCLGGSGDIVAVDKDGRALAALAGRIRRAFPGTTLEIVEADFTAGLPRGPFDGVLAANSLHFVRKLAPLLSAIHEVVRPGGRLVVVEYDADAGNPWVPHPISFDRWGTLARQAGFEAPELLHRVPSRFLGSIYGAVTAPAE